MSRTISTSGTPPDIDGTMVEDTESLRQRIRSAIKFRLGEWWYAPAEGLDYDLILGYTASGQAAQELVSAIRKEGGSEITAIRDVYHNFDRSTRKFTFSCIVDTIYGDAVQVNEVLPNG